MAKEVKTVADMKVGDKILLGQFRAASGLKPNRDEHAISWIKATKTNDFISEHVLTLVEYSCRESNGLQSIYPRDFRQSNLGAFLNSDEDRWFRPAYDGNSWNPYSVMGRHHGFLHYFDDYEVDALVITGGTLHGLPLRVRIPHSREVDKWGGLSPFQLFNRKGVRAHPTRDCAAYFHLGDTSYPTYWTRTADANTSNRMLCMGSDTYLRGEMIGKNIGLRPVCTIKNDAKIVNVAGNTYELEHIDATFIPSDDDLFGMLGLL